jgi:hypothetical protein
MRGSWLRWPSSLLGAWILSGPYLTATIQSLNSLGCLLFVYAVRYGKAIIVVPMVNGLFPLVTIVLSLLIYQQIPTGYNLTHGVGSHCHLPYGFR